MPDREQRALELIGEMSDVEYYLQELSLDSSSEGSEDIPWPDHTYLDLSPEEVCLLLACVSHYVTAESVRLQDQPELEETMLKDATALVLKVAEGSVEKRDA